MNDALNGAASYLHAAGESGLVIAVRFIIISLFLIVAVGIVIWLFSFIASLFSKRKVKDKTKHEKVGIKKGSDRRS